MNNYLLTLGLLIVLIIAGCIENTKKGNDTVLSNNKEELTRIVLKDKEEYKIDVEESKARIGNGEYSVLTFNGLYPGPLLVVDQGSRVSITVENKLKDPVMIHWHGVIPQNKYDGSPVTQNEIKGGEKFFYEVEFDYPGLYWYHSHLDENSQIYKGLFGAILVKPSDENYYPYSSKEEVLMLKDLYIKDGNIIEPSDNMHTKFMGWFGNTFTINGETNYKIKARKGDIIKLYVVNTANARIFNLYFEGLEFIVFGSDLSRFEKPFKAKVLQVSPGERYTIYLKINDDKNYSISHLSSRGEVKMGEIVVEGEVEEKNLSIKSYEEDYKEIREKLDYYLEKPADFNHSLVSKMMGGFGWAIVDEDTKKENFDIPKDVEVGRIYKLKIKNERGAMHSLPHPMHIHGAKMMLIKMNGEKVDNLVWKDTILIPPRSEAEILFMFEKPGKWLYHCHILEHAVAGMMSYFVAS